jgi:hypothetical protein
VSSRRARATQRNPVLRKTKKKKKKKKGKEKKYSSVPNVENFTGKMSPKRSN